MNNAFYKYLKYKDKYLFLQNQIGGSKLKEYLENKGINLLDKISIELFSNNDYLLQLQKTYKFTFWNDLINKNFNVIETNNLICHLNKYFNNIKNSCNKHNEKNISILLNQLIIPEIIIPDENITFNTIPISVTDLSNMTLDYTSKERIYNFEMTHLLFENNLTKKDKYKYSLSALYYYDPNNVDEILKGYIIRILNEYYNNRKMNAEIAHLYEKVKKYEEILLSINGPNFFNKSRYFRIGEISFIKKKEENYIYIENYYGYLMKKGHGLLMLCALLKIFLNEIIPLSIELESATSQVAEKFYIPLGFTCDNSFGCIYCIIEDIKLILEKCNPLPNIKLILKFDNHYIDDLNIIKNSLK